MYYIHIVLMYTSIESRETLSLSREPERERAIAADAVRDEYNEAYCHCRYSSVGFVLKI
jgi:hypothetical protein